MAEPRSTSTIGIDSQHWLSSQSGRSRPVDELAFLSIFDSNLDVDDTMERSRSASMVSLDRQSSLLTEPETPLSSHTDEPLARPGSESTVSASLQHVLSPEHEVPHSSSWQSHFMLDDCNSGLVIAALKAARSGGILYLRPDDCWTAIMAQFSFYLHRHPRLLSSQYALLSGGYGRVRDHNMQSPVCCIVGAPKTHDDVCIEMSARDTLRIMEAVEMEMELRIGSQEASFFLSETEPDFSTTTNADIFAARCPFLGRAPRHHVNERDVIADHPPRETSRYAPSSVVMLGTPDDWGKLRSKARLLRIFGREVCRFHSLLDPLLSRFCEAAEAAAAAAMTMPSWVESERQRRRQRLFWDDMCYAGGQAPPHPSWITGWITAFCFWDEKGETRHQAFFHPPAAAAEYNPVDEPLGDEALYEVMMRRAQPLTPASDDDETRTSYPTYPIIDPESIPSSYVEVPLHLWFTSPAPTPAPGSGDWAPLTRATHLTVGSFAISESYDARLSRPLFAPCCIYAIRVYGTQSTSEPTRSVL